MKSNHKEGETSKTLMKFTPCSLKSGKKYILVLVATKALVIWFIYSRSYELWPATYQSSPTKTIISNVTLYNVSLFHIPLTTQNDMMPFYIEIAPDIWCFLNGLNLKDSRQLKKCKCLTRWYGLDCGIPEAVWKSSFLQQGQKQGVKIQRRKIPRRIIYSMLFLNEYTLLDLIVRDAFYVVDIFLVAEEFSSNSSLLQALKSGYLLEFQSKLMPLQIRNSSLILKSMKEWSLYMQNNLWVHAWQHVTDFRSDDLFLLLHVSSVISKDVLIFLKLYDGFPEPFHFELKPLLYQFQRGIKKNVTALQKFMMFPPLGFSFQYFQSICQGNITKLYSNTCILDSSIKNKFEKNYWSLETWIIGSSQSPSGWQCNWCTSVRELKNSLMKHKWMMKFLNINESLLQNSSTDNFIRAGKWLDGSLVETQFISRYDTYFAPDIIMSDPHKYSFLISNFTF